jgi:hypothetical protein
MGKKRILIADGTEPITKEAVELKNVKVYAGMSEETTAFTATLYINGNKAADVKNDGRGGDNHPRFLDRELEKEFHEFCKSLPLVQPEPEFGDMEPYPMTYDSFIGELLEKWMDNDQWKKACKKGLVFLLKSDKSDSYYTTKAPYSAILAEKVREKHGEDLLEIVNERFING